MGDSGSLEGGSGSGGGGGGGGREDGLEEKEEGC